MLKYIVFLTLSSLYLHAAEPLIVAHRGASGQAPENTIPAFNLAWKQGADAIEADFHLSKDGHIVCIHDKDTKRVSEKGLIVKNTNLAELQLLDVGAKKHARYKGTPIPTIAQVFATVPKDKKIYIEIKVGPEIVPQLLADIKKSKLKNDQIVVISFNPYALAELKKQSPTTKTIWLCNFEKDKQGLAKPSPQNSIEILKKIKADGISTSTNLMGPAFINYFKNQGFEHHVWTVDDPNHARHLKQWGTQSITTNLPETIRKAITPAKELIKP